MYFKKIRHIDRKRQKTVQSEIRVNLMIRSLLKRTTMTCIYYAMTVRLNS